MKAKYKEDPRAWRKSTLFTLLALVIVSSLLSWRHVLTVGIWACLLGVLACLGVLAWFRPQWFRGYYRLSTWAGFWSSQAVARIVLALLFALVITPVGMILRLVGKDPLGLKHSTSATTYWRTAKQNDSLDRLF